MKYVLTQSPNPWGDLMWVVKLRRNTPRFVFASASWQRGLDYINRKINKRKAMLKRAAEIKQARRDQCQQSTNS